MKTKDKTIIALARVIAEKQETIDYHDEIGEFTQEDLDLYGKLVYRLAKMIGIEIPDIDKTANCQECALAVGGGAKPGYVCEKCGLKWEAVNNPAITFTISDGNTFFIRSDDNGV